MNDITKTIKSNDISFIGQFSFLHFNRFFLLILFVFTINQALTQDLQPEWFTVIKGPESEYRQLIEPDNKGNVFATGILSLYDQIYGTEDGFIGSEKIERYNDLLGVTYFTKLDKNGQPLFYRLLTEQGWALPKDIEMDKKGNVYLLCLFTGTLKLGNEMVSNPNEMPNTILIKYDSIGEFKWYKTFLSESEVHPQKIEVNNDSEVTVFADLLYLDHSEVSIGGFIYTFEEGNAFLTHFDESGSLIWLRKLLHYPSSPTVAIRYHRVVDFSIDADGSIYISGYYEDGLYFSENDFLFSSSGSVFIAKYSATNSVEWFKSIDNTNQGALFPIGLFQHDESIGVVILNHGAELPFEINGHPVSQYTIGVEYSKDGVFQTAYDFYTANSSITDMATDKDGGVYLMGGLSSNQLFQYEDIVVQSNDQKWLLIKYNKEKIEWAQFHGNVGMGMELEIDDVGDMYWSGAWGCTAEIFDSTFVAEGCAYLRSDALISKLSSKSVFFEKDGSCSDNPISFKFDYYDFTYPSSINKFSVTAGDKNYEEMNFTHTFNMGETAELKVSLVDNIGRQYSRTFKFDLFELKPEINYSNGTIHLQPLGGVISYTWFKDAQVLTTTTVPYLEIYSAGLYHVQVQASNECLFISNEIEVTEDLITSVEDKKNTDVLIWPNPASDMLSIDTGESSVEISILALDGKVFLKKAIIGQCQIDTSNLQQGIYVVKIKSMHSDTYKKIFIE